MGIGTGMQALGTGMSAFGQMQAGRQQQTAMNYNAAVSEQQAQIIERSGELEAYKLKKSGESFKSSQRAMYGASGVRGTSGSALEVLADSAAMLELDLATLKYNTHVGAMGARSQAAMARWEGQQARKAGTMGAMTTLIGGVGKIASNYAFPTKGLTVGKTQSELTTALDMDFFTGGYKF